MFDTLIIPETNTQYQLTKTWHYVAALREIGCRHFSMGKRGETYIDGKPFDHFMTAWIRVEFRDRGYQFTSYWLRDTILGLAAKNADIQTMAGVPDWMQPDISQRAK